MKQRREDGMEDWQGRREAAAEALARRRWLRADIVLLVTAGGLLVYAIGDVLLLVFAGLALAVALDGLASAVAARTPLSRGWALLAVVLLMLALLIGFGFAVAPQVSEQIRQLWDSLDDAIDAGREWLGGMGLSPDMIEQGINDDGQLREAAGTALSQLAAWGVTTLGAVASLLVMLAIAGFAAADPALYRRGLLRLLPHDRRPLADETLSAVALALRWWFLSQLISMLLLAVTVSLGLWIIGIELWLGLGVLTGLLTFVPYLGPLIAGIPIVVIGFTAGLETGLIVLVFYLVVQNVEGSILVPWIQQKVVHLAPVLAISMQVLMGLLFGIVGFILAAPLAVVGMIMVQKLWMEATLGEEV